jgi:hypothetical protein
MIFADVYNLIGMEYLLWTILKWQKNSFIKCLEEDRRSTALYNVVIVLNFDQRSYHLFIKKYIDKTHIAKLLGTNWDVCLHYGVKEYENAIGAFELLHINHDEFGAWRK